MQNIQERIDQFVANHKWMTMKNQVQVKHLLSSYLDHIQLTLVTKSVRGICGEENRERPYSLEKFLIAHDECKENIIEACFSQCRSQDIPNVAQHIKCAAKNVKFWSKANFGNTRKVVTVGISETSSQEPV